MAAQKFIAEAIKKPGALRKSLGVKKGEKIPEEKLKKAEHSKNPKTRKRAVLAETLKKMSHKKKVVKRRPYGTLRIKLQLLCSYADLCDKKIKPFVDYRAKIILKSVEKTIRVWEKELNYKLGFDNANR